MTWSKRLFDITVSALTLALLSPVMLAITLVIRLRDGAPVFYVSERMRTPERAFKLLKFRTMTITGTDDGVTGGDKSARITPTGRILRATRLDELPQLVNVLAGDLSLVGPRPPLRMYTEAAPQLYAEVLKSRPGLTGLATLIYHGHESRILAGCDTADLTHHSYLRRCVPAKAKLDLIYQKNATLRLDIWILWQTVRAILGARRRSRAPSGTPWPTRSDMGSAELSAAVRKQEA